MVSFINCLQKQSSFLSLLKTTPVVILCWWLIFLNFYNFIFQFSRFDDRFLIQFRLLNNVRCNGNSGWWKFTSWRWLSWWWWQRCHFGAKCVCFGQALLWSFAASDVESDCCWKFRFDSESYGSQSNSRGTRKCLTRSDNDKDLRSWQSNNRSFVDSF